MRLGLGISRRTRSVVSFDGGSDLAIDVDEAGHVCARLYIPILGADLAQAE